MCIYNFNSKSRAVPGQDVPSAGEVVYFVHAISVMAAAIHSSLISSKHYATENWLWSMVHMNFKAYNELTSEVPTSVTGSSLGSICKYIFL